jgi:hypothetical protein
MGTGQKCSEGTSGICNSDKSMRAERPRACIKLGGSVMLMAERMKGGEKVQDSSGAELGFHLINNGRPFNVVLLTH